MSDSPFTPEQEQRIAQLVRWYSEVAPPPNLPYLRLWFRQSNHSPSAIYRALPETIAQIVEDFVSGAATGTYAVFEPARWPSDGMGPCTLALRFADLIAIG